ncbi:gliding motility-associated C-terminal domain-containing protein [Flavobacterium mesophilum]|uniref:gliding motility-associated C-terminal domain-containing protein n=1 Tax=Flavobacterium mesophilum TaxID=3143495 RepID=UPI0031D9AB0D
MKTKILILLFLVLIRTASAQNAQTVNEGLLHVNPNTLVSVEWNFDNKNTGDYENNGEVIFKGNYNNDGITTFDPSFQGFTRFEGFQNQDIKGTEPSDFFDVLFNNANPQPAFRLYNSVYISGDADFTKGIVQSDDFGGSMTFERNATHTHTSNNSHVDGEVTKNGNEGFLYPIGDKGFFRYAAISASGDNNSSFDGHYIFENSNGLYPHDKKDPTIIDIIDDKEYWSINKNKSAADILLTLSWDEATTPAAIIASPQDVIHIVRWDDIKQLWIDEGGAADSDQKTVTTIAAVAGYGVFTLARVKSSDSDDVVIHDAISPNDDGKNDYFYIKNITKYPDNRVEIFNRWGIKVFDTSNYDSNGNVFRGYSDGRATISPDNMLPNGTYFYIVQYNKTTGGASSTIKKAGYLYLSKT